MEPSIADRRDAPSAPAVRSKVYQRVQVILKVVERCNLACSYCYYFEGGDQTYKEKPPTISAGTVGTIASFLRQGVLDLGLRQVWIAFHGGEPFLLKPRVLDQCCQALRQALEPLCTLAFSAQTNGTHLSDEVLAVIERHRIAVSVSIDGDKEAHDRYRRDHRGRGSYDAIAHNYRRLKEFCRARELREPELLSVLDARNDYEQTIAALAEQLGARSFNFLLPDCSYNDGIPHGQTATEYGAVLRQIFRAWAKGSIAVREIDLLLRRFQLAAEKHDAASRAFRAQMSLHENQVIVIRSDGELQLDDTLIPASQWRNAAPRISVSEISLKKYLALPVFREIERIYENPPETCKRCTWFSICGGGDIENRYSGENGFANPSIYCAGLKMFYREVVKYLLRNGYPAEVMRDRLKKTNGTHKYRYAK